MPGFSRVKESDLKHERTQKGIKILLFEQSSHSLGSQPKIPKAQVLYLAPLTTEIVSMEISHRVQPFVKFQIYEM